MATRTAPRAHPIDAPALHAARRSLKKGHLTTRLPLDRPGIAGHKPEAFNEVVEQNERISAPLDRRCRGVGKEGDEDMKPPGFVGVVLAAGCLSVAISYSGWNRCVKQPTTMLLPSILAKSSTRGRRG